MKKQLTFLLTLTFILFFSGIAFADDLQDGLDAYDRKDYKTAHRLFLSSAEQGNAIAQYRFGRMYSNGIGVPKNYKEAIKWFRLSAQQENWKALFMMGQMYWKGRGVPKNNTRAHMWWNICGSTGKGNGICVDNRDSLERDMSPSQIEKAQDMAINWKPKTK